MRDHVYGGTLAAPPPTPEYIYAPAAYDAGKVHVVAVMVLIPAVNVVVVGTAPEIVELPE